MTSDGDRRLLLALAVGIPLALVALVALFVGVNYVGMAAAMDDPFSHYGYAASVSTNATLSNVTLHLPVPVDAAGEPLDANWTVRDGNGTRLDWDVGVVETGSGPMLAVRADEVSGSQRFLLRTFAGNGSLVSVREVGPEEVPPDATDREVVPLATRYGVHAFEQVDGPVETRRPVERGVALAPRTSREDVRCDPWVADEETACERFETVVYARYDAPPDAEVTVTVEFEGWNEWGFMMANSFNEYHERVTVTLVGDDPGWTTAEGETTAGVGRYSP